MIKYVKEKSGIEKPVWVDPLFPAFRGLLDAVLRKVKVQSKSNQCAGGFIERTTREATLYEQAATTYLLKTLHPMSLELEAARKKVLRPCRNTRRKQFPQPKRPVMRAARLSSRRRLPQKRKQQKKSR